MESLAAKCRPDRWWCLRRDRNSHWNPVGARGVKLAALAARLDRFKLGRSADIHNRCNHFGRVLECGTPARQRFRKASPATLRTTSQEMNCGDLRGRQSILPVLMSRIAYL